MLTPEHREKLAAAKRGRKYSPAHRAAISAGVRRMHAEGRGKFKHLLTDEERRVYNYLKQDGQPRNDVLRSIGRADLVRP